MKEKLLAIRAIRRAKAFILTTDQESMMWVDFNTDSLIILMVLKELSRNLTTSIKQLDQQLGSIPQKGAPDGRNQSRRTKSR